MNHNCRIKVLSEVARAYPYLEKLLIAPSYHIGHQILEHLARVKGSWVNFRPATIVSLALEVVGDIIASRNLKMISYTGSLAVVDSVFNGAADEKKLKYFQKNLVNKGMVEALAKTLMELRYNGITSHSLKKDCFISADKEQDIFLLLAKYEEMLEKNSFIDTPGLISLALSVVGKTPFDLNRKFLIPTGYSLYDSERKLIEAFGKDSVIVLEADSVFGLEKPSTHLKAKSASDSLPCTTDIERLKWLFDSVHVPIKPFKDDTVRMFSALGYENEVREVFRRISTEDIPADSVEIIHTDLKDYDDVIYSVSQKLKLPVTFAEGFPSYLTHAGQVFGLFLAWIKNDFEETYLRRILELRALKHNLLDGDKAPSSSTLGFLLRTSGVGWERGRYPFILDKKIKEINRLAEKMRDEGDENAVDYETKAGNLVVLNQICKDLLHLVPEIDANQKILFPSFCAGCIAFLKNYVQITEPQDSVFAESTINQLAMLSGVITTNINFDEAVEKLLNIVSTTRIDASAPKPGHIHVSHYKQGGKSGRDSTFIIGLDNGRFPEHVRQDPILLDVERQCISPTLRQSHERAAENIYELASLVASLRGKVTFSYSSYDIGEGRNNFPSPVLLQVYRVNAGNPSENYNNLMEFLGDSVGFHESRANKTVLDETDWWLHNLVEKEILKNGIESVKTIYEGIAQGMHAKEQRESDVLTEYDGKIISDKNTLDPRINQKLIMSCSRLEKAAVCPFTYFLENILKVRIPEETEKDATVWLDPLERGLLLHEVFQQFGDEVLKEKRNLNEAEQKKLLDSVLEETVKKYKEEIPPPSQRTYDNERTRLKRDIKMFLTLNRDIGTQLFACEVVFGGKKSLPICIPLGETAHILLQGKIDRIDKCGESEYLVWDYKTGGIYKYKERGYISGGEQIQHCLYAVAAEDVLRTVYSDKKAKVVQSGYLFPTEKGMKSGAGGVFPRSTNDRTQWQEALNQLFDLISKGIFIVSDDDVCKYCDYLDVCGGARAKEQIKRKIESGKTPDLAIWENLKKYE